MINIDQRLKVLADLVPNDTFNLADVGTDHAYLPIYLIQTKKAQHIYATDIKEGPLFNAQTNIAKYNLQSQIETRLGSGLLPLLGLKTLDVVIISGMGGKLITKIMENFQDLPLKACYIFEPNTSENQLRKWLFEHNFLITEEKIIEEQNHFYEFIAAYLQNGKQKYSASDILLGPILRKEKNTVFKKKWIQEIKKLKNIKSKRQKAHQITSINDLDQIIKTIEDNL